MGVFSLFFFVFLHSCLLKNDRHIDQWRIQDCSIFWGGMTSIQVVCHFLWFCLSGTAVQLSGRTAVKNFLRESCPKQSQGGSCLKTVNSPCPFYRFISVGINRIIVLFLHLSKPQCCSCVFSVAFWDAGTLKWSPRATLTPCARRENCFRQYPTCIWSRNIYAFPKNLRTENVRMVSVCVSCINTVIISCCYLKYVVKWYVCYNVLQIINVIYVVCKICI